MLIRTRKIVACNHQRSVDYYLESLWNTLTAPIAYACDNYEAFQAGNCTTCGEDGSGCAIIGRKSLDYQKFVPDPAVSRGKRFFMSTAPHAQFFRNYI